MALPDFTRAEYHTSAPLEGEVVGVPVRPAYGLLPLAILYGTGAAIVGAFGYALLGLTHFMVSIVAIGMAWLIAKAMMGASKGLGGRPFQIAAIILTYFSVSLGQTLDICWFLRAQLAQIPGDHVAMVAPLLIKSFLIGPFWELQLNFASGAIGLLILFIGLRTAWRLTAGGDAQYRRISIFGPR